MDLNLFFKPLTEDLLQYGLDAWEAPIQQRINQVFAEKSHGLLEPWWAAYQALPDASIINTDHSANCVSAVAHSNHSAAEQQQLIDGLLTWMPWRKGPYCIANVHIDTEWRSDMKWQRILPHISPLKGKKVLDVGCGNGYHMWRMLGEGAELVLGVDPSQFFLFQFQALKKYLGPHMPIHLMPLTSEQLYDLSPAIKLAEFDTVFSMGVLYHRASPIDHLKELLAMLKPGGELVLETLIVEEAELLLPDERYAKMRNVWFIPSVELLLQMIKRAGFIEACCVDISVTTVEEQRATEWMTFESLADFLNPDDPSLTIEGYPAPVRAAIRARKKA